ncbi:MAG: phosphate ABC transporter substrate-binding protein PstS [Chitinivibrionales bacterium]|nr:phosphate ABC transporter substrate-binding protein PstS [Chitinivibrionales bacterium]MBD3356914.1 phosphate ABC transporter substrate-binding protein PstS [Chitinivibrionales bacterium]
MGLVRQRMLPVLLTVMIACASGDIVLTGAGATFPLPLYKKWFSIYRKDHSTRIIYEPSGSSGGIRRLRERAVDFGATDAFLADPDLESFEGDILHVPTCVGAVVVTYNIPGVPTLCFTPELLAKLFGGDIKNWSDRRLARANPGVELPDLNVTVVHRSEGSGTTHVFTHYLAKVCSEWAHDVGYGKTVRWPVGIGVEGNPGVAAFVKKIAGSIGYIELTYASDNDLPVAAIMNRAGKFIDPTIEAVTAAADVAIPKDARVSLIDTPAPLGYPITSFTYLIVYREQNYGGRSLARARELGKLLWWAVHDGQEHNNMMLYAPLPSAAIKRSEKLIRSITYKGKRIY